MTATIPAFTYLQVRRCDLRAGDIVSFSKAHNPGHGARSVWDMQRWRLLERVDADHWLAEFDNVHDNRHGQRSTIELYRHYETVVGGRAFVDAQAGRGTLIDRAGYFWQYIPEEQAS